jgi:hypothetical protein
MHEELLYSFPAPNIRAVKLRRVRMKGACSTHGVDEKCIAGKPERKGSLEKPRRRWDDKINWILKREGVRTWTEFNWLRTVSGGRLL